MDLDQKASQAARDSMSEASETQKADVEIPTDENLPSRLYPGKAGRLYSGEAGREGQLPHQEHGC